MWEWIGENYKTIIGLATFVGMAWKGVSMIIKYINKEIVQKLNNITDLQNGFKEIQASNANILKELQPNGGSSIKDQIKAIRTDIAYVKAREASRIYIDRQPQWECDINGHCVKVNKAWTELTGLSENDAAGNGWMKAIHDSDRVRVLENWEEAVHNNNSFFMRFRIRNKITNEIYFVKAVADIKRNDKRFIDYILGTMEIIEEEKTKKHVPKTA